jgi:hypothetical protein
MYLLLRFQLQLAHFSQNSQVALLRDCKQWSSIDYCFFDKIIITNEHVAVRVVHSPILHGHIGRIGVNGQAFALGGRAGTANGVETLSNGLCGFE